MTKASQNKAVSTRELQRNLAKNPDLKVPAYGPQSARGRTSKCHESNPKVPGYGPQSAGVDLKVPGGQSHWRYEQPDLKVPAGPSAWELGRIPLMTSGQGK